ncbi:MAG: thiamine phosphate synthase [Alphaproteobacteria bacterium]
MGRGTATLARIAEALQAESRWAGARLPALWFLTDEARTPDPAAVAAVLPPGTGIILRHYAHPGREGLARELAARAEARGLRLVVAADVGLARLVGAAGVHLPRWAAPIRPPTDLWLTAAAHSAADFARRRGADAYFVGPVFETASHPEGNVLGPARLASLARLAPAPVIALGGITAGNARRLAGTGVAGLAAIGALLPGAG